jgi:NAD-dependent dihydropyrimidine dehydrogenase PreA subunit
MHMAKKELQNHCHETSGKLMPLVNFNNCGAKEDCVAVCPYDVFEMRPITVEDAANLNLKGKIKTFFNKNKAYVAYPEDCYACGLCVQACPERAIKLTKYLEDIGS